MRSVLAAWRQVRSACAKRRGVEGVERWRGSDGDGEPDFEAAAGAVVVGGDLAAVGLDEPAGDGQPEAGAAVAGGGAGGAATEGDVEDPVELVGGDAAAGVVDPHHGVVGV